MLKHRNVGCRKRKAVSDYKHVQDPVLVDHHTSTMENYGKLTTMKMAMTSKEARETMRNSG